MADSRRVRKRRRRKRRRKLLSSVVVILFLSMVVYTTSQYIAGQDLAEQQADGGIDKENAEQTKQEFEERDQIENSEVKQKDEKVNVLLVGSDQRDEENARTDTIMIAQYDTGKGTVKLASIMRDLWVNIPGHGYNRINASYSIGDVPLLTETIEKNFGIHIDDYAVVNFNGFKHIVDTIAPDGVEIDVEKRMYYQDYAGTINIDLQPGVQKLDGEELLGYARFRNDAQGDFNRVIRQQKVISALKEEITSFTTVAKLPKTVGILNSYINTSMSSNDIVLNYGRKFLMNTPENIETARIPAEGEWWPMTTNGGAEVLGHNEQQTKDTIQSFFNTNKDEGTQTAEKDQDKEEEAS